MFSMIKHVVPTSLLWLYLSTVVQNGKQCWKLFSTSKSGPKNYSDGQVLCHLSLCTPSAQTTKQIKPLHLSPSLILSFAVGRKWIFVATTSSICLQWLFNCPDCIIPLGGSLCCLTGRKWKAFVNFFNQRLKKVV